jgi:Fis family transcriptional regulator
MSLSETNNVRSFPNMEGVRHKTVMQENQTIRHCVESAMRNYFNTLEGHDVTNLYEMVLAEMEVPLLEVVLEQTRGNQSQAAEILGLNRGTLRKKMKAYDLL